MAIVEQRTVTRSVEPDVVTEHPQDTYETKKTIFRASQIVWYILGVLETLLLFRLFFKLIGANPASPFVDLIYTISEPFVLPFKGIVASAATQGSVFEWAVVIAAFVYVCLAWGVIYLLDLFFPITPRDV